MTKKTLTVIVGLFALLTLLLVLLANVNLNRFKPWLDDKVSRATGRSFAINGDLSLSWHHPAQRDAGWRGWIPWPHFQADDVTLGNVDWSKNGKEMAHVQRVDFNLELLPLLRKKINIDSLVLTEPRLLLERDKEGRNNWTFKNDKNTGPSEWKVAFYDLALTRGTVRYADQEKRADVTARLDAESGGGTNFALEGELNGDKVTGKGKAGALLTLQKKDVKYPVQAELHVGNTDIYADGTFTDPTKLSALDVNLKILGASMAQLFPLTGVLLPETPKFSTQGRVHGTLAKHKIDLTYEDFEGRVGSSDIGGTLRYLQRGENQRPILRGDVTSHMLNFKDLGALVGADSKVDRQKRGAVAKQPPDKVLPVEPFKTDRWAKIDAEVKFTGKKIVRSESFPIDDLFTRIKMADGVLTLNPLNFGVAGGKLKTDIKIDGSVNPAKAELTMDARGLQVKRLFPKLQSMRASVGELNAGAKLTAVGNSPAALLASSNGELHALVNQGSISKFILEAMGLNIGSVIVSKLFGDRQVDLNCMASDLTVRDGLMETRYFVVDTTDATINVDGQINFGKESMDMRIYPDSKGVRIISLRSPLYLKGTFKHPDVGVNKAVVAAKAGAAVVLGTVAAPAAALLALINPGPDEETPCQKLLAQSRQAPTAPPPGKNTASAK